MATLGVANSVFIIPMTAFVPGVATFTYPLATCHQILSGSTNIFLVAKATFTASTLTAYGYIAAVRVG